MNRLNTEKRAAILVALTEGNSLRSTSRLTGATLNTVMRLLVDVGRACAVYQDEQFRELKCAKLQLDEIWSFCYSKQAHVPADKQGIFGYGDVWTWTAICAKSKLVPCWLVGPRDAGSATAFLQDLASRLAVRPQITSDGNRVYVNAVEDASGSEVDYAMLVKLYGSDPAPQTETRYSPAECIGCREQVIQGNPDAAHVSTSYAERQNLTMRISMRRYTRLTNGFSKKIENHMAAVALHSMAYNFVREQRGLGKISPAMAAGVTQHLWRIEEIAALVP
jgi:IS1 family transposase